MHALHNFMIYLTSAHLLNVFVLQDNRPCCISDIALDFSVLHTQLVVLLFFIWTPWFSPKKQNHGFIVLDE